ncbi:MAG TPA: hypothetical protein VLN49_00300 [Gemmatimonadaceae bacterium]|nr:hypothetical protein [Gemmatimonadaceae bacterium]
MKAQLSIFLACAFSTACHHAGSDWAHAPLAPVIRFTELAAPRSIVVLALDAHSGAPLPQAEALIPALQLRANGDTAGVIRLRPSRPGAVQLTVRLVGYEVWRAAVVVSDSAGVALVAQLRRSKVPLTTVEVRDSLR